MGCNRSPTESENSQIQKSASTVAAVCGADPSRAESYVRMYGETVAILKLQAERADAYQQAMQAQFAALASQASNLQRSGSPAPINTPNPFPPPGYQAPSLDQPANQPMGIPPISSLSAGNQSPWETASPSSGQAVGHSTMYGFELPNWLPREESPTVASTSEQRATVPERFESGAGSQSVLMSESKTLGSVLTQSGSEGTSGSKETERYEVTSRAGVTFRYTGHSPYDFQQLPSDGSPVVFAEDLQGNPVGTARMLKSGAIAIRTCLNDGTGSLWGAGRQDFESYLPLGRAFGYANVARAHAAGQGTGPESPYGIAFADKAINAFQNEGIEEDIRQLADQLKPGHQLEQHVEIETDSSGLKLRVVRYQVEVEPPGESKRILYSRELEVSEVNGRLRVELDPEPEWPQDLDRYLVPPEKRTSARVTADVTRPDSTPAVNTSSAAHQAHTRQPAESAAGPTANLDQVPHATGVSHSTELPSRILEQRTAPADPNYFNGTRIIDPKSWGGEVGLLMYRDQSNQRVLSVEGWIQPTAHEQGTGSLSAAAKETIKGPFAGDSSVHLAHCWAKCFGGPLLGNIEPFEAAANLQMSPLEKELRNIVDSGTPLYVQGVFHWSDPNDKMPVRHELAVFMKARDGSQRQVAAFAVDADGTVRELPFQSHR